MGFLADSFSFYYIIKNFYYSIIVTNIIKLLYIITISLNYVMLFKYFKITFFANLVSCKVTFLFGKHECKTLDWKRNEDL